MAVVTDSYQNIIQTGQLKPILSNCILLDCRAKLGDPNWGRARFLEGHIEGAQYANLDQDLAAPPGAGGRHPLPERAIWLDRVRQWGVDEDSQVVLYDDAGGAYAARAWWMFRWLGHAKVAVLDGGLSSWNEPLEVGETDQRQASSLSAKQPLTHLISAAELLTTVQNRTTENLIDARAQARFDGREEPIDPIAGHIPGAQCLPFQDNLTSAGYFKSAELLRQRFAGCSEHAIHYCGSGVTATHNILAMHIAGLPEPTLFADSWSGWITNPAHPIETA